MVTDHRRGQVAWGADGASTATADAFFDEFGSDRSAQIEAISMDMGPGYAKSARASAPQATRQRASLHTIYLRRLRV